MQLRPEESTKEAERETEREGRGCVKVRRKMYKEGEREKETSKGHRKFEPKRERLEKECWIWLDWRLNTII